MDDIHTPKKKLNKTQNVSNFILIKPNNLSENRSNILDGKMYNILYSIDGIPTLCIFVLNIMAGR